MQVYTSVGLVQILYCRRYRQSKSRGENAETELFETFDALNEEYVSRTAPTSGTIKLDLGLDADAGEFFEGKTIEIKVTVQALQLRNTSDGNWEDMFSERYYVS